MKIPGHHHTFKFVKRGTGKYVKGKQRLVVPAPGWFGKCECTQKMFFPDHPELHPAEADEVE